jgi:hypothetical protein
VQHDCQLAGDGHERLLHAPALGHRQSRTFSEDHRPRGLVSSTSAASYSAARIIVSPHFEIEKAQRLVKA